RFKPGEILPQFLGYPATGSSRKSRSTYPPTPLCRQAANSRPCVSPRKRIHELSLPVTSAAQMEGTRQESPRRIHRLYIDRSRAGVINFCADGSDSLRRIRSGTKRGREITKECRRKSKTKVCRRSSRNLYSFRSEE